ncbi:hypothetical protein DdX_21761 [Ditylenchus destructor]|uniref:Uncharacterized protein n=1 Tax=Ditylenchus destructor TaxID=166010 RepID=A0AAD4MJ55_9BILA|nr:hypothetical protein DdX_21761 [Ditylenchus destructor]
MANESVNIEGTMAVSRWRLRTRKKKPPLVGGTSGADRASISVNTRKQRYNKQAIDENYELSPSVPNAFPADEQIDLVGHCPVHVTDLYDPNRFMSHSLLYKKKSGYWKPIAGGGREFVSFRKGFALRSVEQEHLDVTGLFTRFSL